MKACKTFQYAREIYTAFCSISVIYSHTKLINDYEHIFNLFDYSDLFN